MPDDAGDGKRGVDGGRLGLRKLRSGESMWSVFRNRWVKLVLALLCVGGVGYLVYALRSILVPFGLAVVMAYILNPVVELLHAKLRWPRLAVVLALVGVFTVVVLSVTLSVAALFGLVLVDVAGDYASRYRSEQC